MRISDIGGRMSDEFDGTEDHMNKVIQEDYQLERRLRAMVRVTTLEPRLELFIRDAVADCYQSIGHDVWGNDRTPDTEEYVDVMLDRARDWYEAQGPYHEITTEEWLRFHALPRAQKRALCLEVGP